MTAITWGWSVDETAERLMEESAKAQANGKGYAELTARNAALAVERRKQQPQRRGPQPNTSDARSVRTRASSGICAGHSFSS